MAGDVSVAVVEFKLLADRLRAAGHKGFRDELYKAVSDAGRPITDAIRRATPDYLPKRGGYAELMAADLDMAVVRKTGSDAGAVIRVRARPFAGDPDRRVRRNRTGRKVALVNAGKLTHPLFGDREHWYTQGIRPGFASETFLAHADDARSKVLDAMRHVAEQITGKEA